MVAAGCLMYELFSGSKLSKTEELRNIACLPKVGLTVQLIFVMKHGYLCISRAA